MTNRVVRKIFKFGVRVVKIISCVIILGSYGKVLVFNTGDPINGIDHQK